MLKHKQRSSKHARADLTWGTDIKMQVGDLTFLQALNASPVIWKKKEKKKKKGKVNIPLLFLNAHYLMSTGNADLILLWQKGRAKDSLKCLSRFFPFPLTRTLPLCVCVCVCARTNAHHSLSPLIIITTVGKIITVGHSWTSRLKEHCNCGFVFTKERLMMN